MSLIYPFGVISSFQTAPKCVHSTTSNSLTNHHFTLCAVSNWQCKVVRLLIRHNTITHHACTHISHVIAYRPNKFSSFTHNRHIYLQWRQSLYCSTEIGLCSDVIVNVIISLFKLCIFILIASTETETDKYQLKIQ